MVAGGEGMPGIVSIHDLNQAITIGATMPVTKKYMAISPVMIFNRVCQILNEPVI